MTKSIPDKLYKYRPFDARALNMLIADEVYFADPRTFNDPLDVQPTVKIDVPEEDLEQTLEQLIKNRVAAERKLAAKLIKAEGPKLDAHIAKVSEHEAKSQVLDIGRYAAFWGETENQTVPTCDMLAFEMAKELRGQYEKGIFSLSERFDCPLMWSHYGDEHRGLCVGYSLPGNSRCDVQPVIYGGSREVEASKITAMLREDSSARQDVDQAVLLRKAHGWSYEKEWRLIGSRGTSGSPLEMEEVIFGMRCEPVVQFAVVSALSRRERPILFYEMTVDEGGFDLRKNLLDTSELFSELPRRARDIDELFSTIVE